MTPTYDPRDDRRDRDVDDAGSEAVPPSVGGRAVDGRTTGGETTVSAASGDESGSDSQTLDRTYRLLRLVKVLLAILVSLLTLARVLGVLPA
ncbi:MAG: hypothetical protein ABEJ22_07875 [Haloferacaceae archaeon]